MKRPALRCAVIAAVLTGCRNAPDGAGHAPHAGSAVPVSSNSGAIIEYQGQPIRLTKRYDDFDDYKNDPDNIAPEEYARVQTLVKGASVPERCADIREVLMAAHVLDVPGYGMRSFGKRDAEGGRPIVAHSIEIPHADADRYIVYMGDSSGYRLVDDVVLPEQTFVQDVDIRDGAIVYLDRDDHVVVKRPMRTAR